MIFRDFWRIAASDYQGLLFDIDGTLFMSGKVLPGAAELLAELKKNNFPHYLLTNDGNNSTQQKSSYLKRAGLAIEPEEIISCSSVIAELAQKKGWLGRKFFVAGHLGEPCFGEGAGLVITKDPAEIEDCFGVIQAEGYYDWHNSLQAVMNFFRRHPDRPYIVPNPDSYWPGMNGLGVGAGGQARFIIGILGEMHIKIEPLYLGKPSRAIFDYALHMLNRKFTPPKPITSANVIMLGDSLQSDITGGNSAGMTTALVLTGITSAEAVARATGPNKPKLIFETL